MSVTGPAVTPIEDYAIIGDCRTAALIARGSIDWLCLPDFSSPSVFAAAVDSARGGHFTVRPVGPFTSRRRYLDATPVLETTFTTSNGVVRLIDLVPLGDDARSLSPLREVLRIVEGISGTVELEIVIDPRPEYGRMRPVPSNSGALGWCYRWRNELLLVRTDAKLAPAPGGLSGTLRVGAGERSHLSLAYTCDDIGIIVPLGADADRRMAETYRWWQQWSGRCRYDGRHREVVLRSALTLKLLAFAPSGAVIAAPTTSLPESIGGERNWDYRFCWLRDAGLTTGAFVGLGHREEARCFLSWLLHTTRLTWPKLRAVYDVYGRPKLSERSLDHLDGYAGSQPVRVGNAAAAQRQLDAYGQVVLAAETLVNVGEGLDTAEARMLAGLGRTVARQWREPDSGIWEIRGPPRQYTFSKVMCWVALDRLLALDRRGKVRLGRHAAELRRERDAIAATIEERGFNPSIGSYVSELDGDRVDASLLLMSCIGYKHATDRRLSATHDRIRQRLGRGNLLYRYEHGYDGFDSHEGAFGICSFWAVDNLARRGNVEAAERMFEDLLGYASDVGLFGEEIDPDSGRALGNFPQAFTHVGLINAALTIERARRGTIAHAA